MNSFLQRTRLLFVVESGTDVRVVEGLCQRFDLTILARQIPGGTIISHPPSEPVATIATTSSRIGFAFATLRRFLRRASAPDAVLVQGYGLAALAANIASRMTGVPTAMLVCSPAEAYYECRAAARDPSKPFRQRELALIRLFAWLNAKIGRHYVVLSRHLADVVSAYNTRAKIDVIPVYGVDPTRFAPVSEPKAEIRRRLGIPVDGHLIFFSSRIAPEKDALALLDAVRIVVDQGMNVRILHCSGGYQAFVEVAAARGLENRVVAMDAVHPVRDLPSYYQAADLCVQASRAEGLGFSPLEALACDVPVVATAVGGLTENIIDGRTGWTYPVGDAAALARAIRAALEDPADASRRAAEGRAWVADRFARETVFSNLEQVIQQRLQSVGTGNEAGSLQQPKINPARGIR